MVNIHIFPCSLPRTSQVLVRRSDDGPARAERQGRAACQERMPPCRQGGVTQGIGFRVLRFRVWGLGFGV